MPRLTRSLYFELVDLFETPDPANRDTYSVASSGMIFPVVDCDADRFYNYDV